MKQVTRLAIGVFMLAGLVAAAIVPAPATTDVAFADGGAPTPFCRPSDRNCQ